MLQNIKFNVGIEIYGTVKKLLEVMELLSLLEQVDTTSVLVAQVPSTPEYVTYD